jgi:hypothetical protein
MSKTKGPTASQTSDAQLATTPNGWVKYHASFMNRLLELRPNEHRVRLGRLNNLLRWELWVPAYADALYGDPLRLVPDNPTREQEIAALKAILKDFERVYDCSSQPQISLDQLKELDEMRARAISAAKDRLDVLEGKDLPVTLQPDEAQGFLSAPDIADKYSVPLGALRRRLERWRAHHFDDYRTVTDRRRREPLYLYPVATVWPIVDKLRNKQFQKRPSNVRRK